MGTALDGMTTHSAHGRHKSTATEHRTRLAAAIPVATVAVIAGIVSYTHIVSLGARAHQGYADAHLLPFAVDGLIVAGVVIVLAGYGLGWLSIGLGVAATVFANVESGVPYGPLAAAVAAWPAVAFSVASFVLERWLKTRCLTDLEVAPEPVVQVTPEPVPSQPEDTSPAPRQATPRRKTQVTPKRVSAADLRRLVQAEFDADPSVSVTAAAKNLGRGRDTVRPVLEKIRREANVQPLERKAAAR